MRSERLAGLGTVLLALVVWLLAATPVRAGQLVAIHASAGQFNTLNHGPSYEAGWGLSFAPRRFRWLPRFLPNVSPTFGTTATSRGTLYVYGGFRLDLPLTDAWRVSPQLAAGAYYRDAGRNLGGPLEFRSGIELSRRVGARSHVGLLLYHLSNAGFHELNPGTESLVLTYSTRP